MASKKLTAGSKFLAPKGTSPKPIKRGESYAAAMISKSKKTRGKNA